MGYKSPTTKKALADIKEKHKKENTEMKTPIWKYVVTVAVTLAVVYGGYLLFSWGYNQGKTDQKSITVEAKELAVQLKQNQK